MYRSSLPRGDETTHSRIISRCLGSAIESKMKKNTGGAEAEETEEAEEEKGAAG